MRTLSMLILVLGCFGLLVMGTGGPADSSAQKAVEICDDGKDNDGDKKIDCDDPDCSKDPSCDGGEPCSPGYWKNHPGDWVGICCDNQSDPTCDAIDSALRARGPGGNLLRAGAAAFLEACVGQPCNDD